MKVKPISKQDLNIISQHSTNDNPAVIIPHDNPDADAILSSTLLHLVLEKLNIPSLICYRTGISEETNLILNQNKLMKPNTYTTSIPKNAKLILTDWFNVPNCDNEVIAIFDHHPTTQKLTAPIIVEEEYTSCTKLIYDLFINDIDFYSNAVKREIEHSVLYSLFLDSNSLKSTRVNKDDLPWIDNTIEKYNYDREHLTKVGYCLNDLTLPIEKLARNGEKSYVLPNGKNAYTSYIMVMNYDRGLDEAIAKEMENIRQEKDADYSWCLVCDLGKDMTHIYKLSREDNGVGLWTTYNDNLSRAKDVYPMLEEMNR